MPYVASKKKTKVERKPSTRSAKTVVSAPAPEPVPEAVEEPETTHHNGVEAKKSKANGSSSQSSQNGRHQRSATNGSQLNGTTNGGNVTAINEESLSTSDLSTGTNNLTVNLTTASVATTASSRALFLADPIPPIVRSFKAGSLLAVGENLSNQLGLGDEVDNRKKPQLVKQLPQNIVQVAAGGMHSACLTRDGLVYIFFFLCFIEILTLIFID